MLTSALRKTAVLKTCHTLSTTHIKRNLPRFLSGPSNKSMPKVEEQLLEDKKNDYLEVSKGSIIRSDQGEQYEAVRKLGWGVNSTVWVGRDLDEEASPKFVALKILTKSATEASEHTSSNELDILQRAITGKEPPHRPQVPTYRERKLPGPPHPGWPRIYGLRSAFTCDDSQHLVLVSIIYGEHMRDYMANEPEKRLPVPYAKVVARQTLLALDYLHKFCGIIHCDVKPENILRDFGMGPNVDEIFERVMKLEPDAGKDGRTTPLWIPHVIEPEHFYVALSDFSHSTWSDFIQRSTRAIGSPALKAPELVLGFAYGTAIDIWSFGCTMYELLTGKVLFRFPDGDARSPNELAQEPKYHLSLMQKIIEEPFSPASSNAVGYGKGLIGADGWMNSPPEVEPLTLEERISRDAPQGMEDKEKFAAFLRRCLRLDQSNRATAAELYDDPWLAEEHSVGK